jgi:methylenetetrahydrofolate dehydrogenase (NADP+)/methenyltetrahydrofolate cyclohydrolase
MLMAKILDGSSIANEIKQEIKLQIEQNLKTGKTSHPPSLAVILCSEDPASKIYVQKKMKACQEVGIESTLLSNHGSTMPDLLQTIDDLNRLESINGILVQLPLPIGLNQNDVFDYIDPLKDVDVFSPENVGLLVQGRPRFIPCTPAGIQELLTRSGIQISGKKICIINRSNVVGRPLHALLIQDNDQANATCTLCHDRTPPETLKEMCLSSDIIVVAVGKPNFLTSDMVTERSIVIDVGINRLEGTKKIVGDVCHDVYDKVFAYSPVPGGCGLLTVACLLKNVLLAQKLQLDRSI